MEMEHINENTIRVLIGHEDLEERGVSFLDLLAITKKSKISFIVFWKKLISKRSSEEAKLSLSSFAKRRRIRTVYQ